MQDLCGLYYFLSSRWTILSRFSPISKKSFILRSCFIYFVPILMVWKHRNYFKSHSFIKPLSSPVTTTVLPPMLSAHIKIDLWSTSFPTTIISCVRLSYCHTLATLLKPNCKILSVPEFKCKVWHPEYYISTRETNRDLLVSSLWIWSYLLLLL